MRTYVFGRLTPGGLRYSTEDPRRMETSNHWSWRTGLSGGFKFLFRAVRGTLQEYRDPHYGEMVVARVIDEDLVDSLHQIDAVIDDIHIKLKSLIVERDELLVKAAKRGRKVKVTK